MDTLFEVKVTTDGCGLVRVALEDGDGVQVSAAERTFGTDDAEEMMPWINAIINTATVAAATAGLL